MADPIELALAAITGGGGTVGLQLITGWWKARAEGRKIERDADVTLEQHRDQLTFDLLTAAREEMSELRTELSTLRPLSSRIAHLEEALDHLHALLHAEGDAERNAAERRARAFLSRMRPTVGDLRSKIQRAQSDREYRERYGIAPRELDGEEV